MLKKLVSTHVVVYAVSYLLLSQSQAQQNVQYVPDSSLFPNPERGWAIQFTPECCDDVARKIIYGPHPQLSSAYLKALRNGPDDMTVYMDVVKIRNYDSDIPQDRLNEIQADLDAARAAGVKVNFRICYNYGMTYGEPKAYWIDRHLDQLGPIIQKNADVIFALDAGMFGGCGETCCNSGFIDESVDEFCTHIKPEGMQLMKKLFSFLPESRFMLMRYPRYKFDMLGITNGRCFPASAAPLTPDNAFNGSLQARLGYHNDNFAGDEDHYGFFNCWQSAERSYTELDSRFALMRGEISAATNYNMIYGVREMKKYHFTIFHGIGNNSHDDSSYDGWREASRYWKKTGQYDSIQMYLGYRFRLVSGSVAATSIKKSGLLNLKLVMVNDGWAAIVNPRNIEIVFRNTNNGVKYVLGVNGDNKGNRLWLPEAGREKILSLVQRLPVDIETGTYELMLHLADPYPSLHDRPEYSIRLANKDIWEATTGYNKLGFTIVVTE